MSDISFFDQADPITSASLLGSDQQIETAAAHIPLLINCQCHKDSNNPGTALLAFEQSHETIISAAPAAHLQVNLRHLRYLSKSAVSH